jgi:hypothetical protein
MFSDTPKVSAFDHFAGLQSAGTPISVPASTNSVTIGGFPMLAVPI